ncbi:hypothetical protein FE36_11935 [Xanthomonas oryzae pv. oryzicola]|nr:hypothetical protein FE36_11935 [Xanthomonas oryzae pv. oryzicola]KOR41202.1 hypothetical protein ADT27_19525 [Xanthomonas oryzae]
MGPQVAHAVSDCARSDHQMWRMAFGALRTAPGQRAGCQAQEGSSLDAGDDGVVRQGMQFR